jgi:hypothetical protein
LAADELGQRRDHDGIAKFRPHLSRFIEGSLEFVAHPDPI